MEPILTKQDFLDMLTQQSKTFDEKLEKSRVELESELKQSRTEFDRQNLELKKRIANLTDAWGDFAEALIKPNLLTLFQERGINVIEKYEHVEIKRDKQTIAEIDFLLVDTVYAIAIEVKNKLRTEDVNDHLERLDVIRTAPPRVIKGYVLLGAVAATIVSQEVENYAIKKGLFVLKQTGDIITIANPPDFKQQEWLLPPA